MAAVVGFEAFMPIHDWWGYEACSKSEIGKQYIT
jgi:hypothetical protein